MANRRNDRGQGRQCSVISKWSTLTTMSACEKKNPPNRHQALEGSMAGVISAWIVPASPQK